MVQGVVPGGEDSPGEWGGMLRESYLIGKPQSFSAAGGRGGQGSTGEVHAHALVHVVMYMH